MIITEKDVGREVVTSHGAKGVIVAVEDHATVNIFTPHSVYPDGYVYDCGTWTYALDGTFPSMGRKGTDCMNLHFVDEQPQPEEVKQEPERAMRFNSNKFGINLLPLDGIIELVRVYTVGAFKYKPNNWLKGMPWEECAASLDRHWFKWRCGHNVDPDTGCHHLAHVMWNALTLLVYQLRGIGKDDRTKINIDDDFNLVHNPLGIGLSPEKLEELQNKYKKQRGEE